MTDLNLDNCRDDFRPISELMQKDLPPVSWLIKEIIPDGGVVVIAAKPASFKTWFTLQMAIDIASGDNFLGRFETQQSPVLILDGESGERMLKSRLEILKAPNDLPIYYKSYSGRKELESMFLKTIVGFCKKNGVKLVIFDSLIRFMSVKDENSSAEISKALKWISMLKDEGISSILIHHSRKGSGNFNDSTSLDSVRGSGDIVAACDVGIVISNRKDNTVVVRMGKNRYDEERSPFKVEFKKESCDYSHWRYIGDVEENKDNDSVVMNAVIEILETSGDSNQKQIVKQIKDAGNNIGEKRIRSILNEMTLDGRIACNSGNRTEKIYTLGGRQNG